MSIKRTLILTGMGLALFCGMQTVPAIGLLAPTGAEAQQFGTFNFKTRNNATRANIAIYLKQLGSSGSASSGANGALLSSGSSQPGINGGITQYSSTTIGNLTEITTILDGGAEGYISLNTDQDGTNSSQTSSTDGTQVSGGNAAIGGNIENANATTNNNITTASDGDQDGESGDDTSTQ